MNFLITWVSARKFFVFEVFLNVHILLPGSVSTAQLPDCSAAGGWPCFLGFSQPTYPPPPLALAPSMLFAPPGGPPSLGHSPPRFLHGFPHPSPRVCQGHVLRRPDLPKTCRVLPSHPTPCSFATRLGDMLSCAPAVTVLPVLHWPLHGQGWEGACSVSGTKQVFGNCQVG